MTHIKRINEFFDDDNSEFTRSDEFQSRLSRIIRGAHEMRNNPKFKTLIDANGEEPQWYIAIADKYDEAAYDAFQYIISDVRKNTYSDIETRIESIAEENERENGTEMECILDFMEDVLSKCGYVPKERR